MSRSSSGPLGCVVAALLLGCPAAGSKPVPGSGDAGTEIHSSDPTAESYLAAPLPLAQVRLHDAFGGIHPVDVEVASTPITRQRGLMWRTQLAEGKGMLFVFPEVEEQSFWMKNTLLSLDMIFIDADLKIAGIVARTEPRSLESRGVGKPSLYVLEVPGGWSEKISLRAGGAVELLGVAEIPVQP